MALTFGMKVTGLCSGIIAADRKRIDAVLINANATMTEIPYHLQTLLIETQYLVPPPGGRTPAPPLGSYRGRLDINLYQVPEAQFTAWDLNGAIVRVCEGGNPITDPQLTVRPLADAGECCNGDWSDLHWVLEVGALAAAIDPALRIDPDWRTISSLTLAIFEMLKGSVRGTDPYYTAVANRILMLEGRQEAQSFTDAWIYEYRSPDDTLLLQVDRGGVISYIACRVPAGDATVSALLVNEGVPGSNPMLVPHMLAYYDLLGPAGLKPQPALRRKLVETGRSCLGSTGLGEGSSCMSSVFSQP